jgi:nitrite reductase/ring-hydroxylating ferredoxin subunit
MDMAVTPPAPGEARCPGAPSVQDVLAKDPDKDRQPASYRLESYTFLGDKDVPFERYTSPDFFKAEMDLMWPRVRQWACREDHVREPGDYYVYDTGPYSLLITRDEASEIHAYYNACLHRGTRLKPSFTEGWSPKLTCPFHGWSWSLDGKLTDLPCAWDFPPVDQEQSRLREARVGTWGGFVFVCLDETAPPLDEYLAPLPDHAVHADLADRYVALHVQKELPCWGGRLPTASQIYDQDTGNMGWRQVGMGAAKKKTATFANYQESRIRHIHQTIDTYLGLKGTELAAG